MCKEGTLMTDEVRMASDQMEIVFKYSHTFLFLNEPYMSDKKSTTNRNFPLLVVINLLVYSCRTQN